MNRITNIRFARLVMLLLVCQFGSGGAQAQTTAFTYQGKLLDAGNPATGAYDLQFKLFDALSGGAQAGATNTVSSVAVNNGIFSVTLDFGAAAFPGANRWLEIGVRPGGSAGAFTTLSPLQPISSTPYAVQSLNAASATNASNAVSFSGPLAGDVSGTQSATTLANNAVTTVKLADGSVTNAKIADVAGSKLTGAITTATLPGANVTGAVANATNAVNATTATNATNATNAASADALSAACNGCVTGARIAPGQVVKSFNGLFDTVTLAAGSNITLTPAGNTLTISAASAANNWALTGNAGTTPSTNFLGTTDNQPLVFKTNGAELMRLSAAGNLGIGTITPGSKLTVAGVIETTSGGLKFPDGTTQTSASNGALTAVAHDASLSGNGTSGTPLGIAANGVGTTQLADNAVTGAKIVASGVGTTQLASNAVTGAKIASGQVVKSLNGLFDTVTLAAGSNITLTPSGNTLTIAAGGAANNWSLTGNAGSTPSLNFLGTTDNQPLAFRINGAEVMRMIAGGNVGIGTASPLARLHVEGTSNAAAQVLVRGTANVDPSIELGSTESGVSALEGLDIKYINSIGESVFNNIYTPSTNAFRFQSGATDRMVIQSAGNVGIGATPLYKLHVAAIGNHAIYGQSDIGIAVWGQSTSNSAVYGQSASGYGVQGLSASGTGVYGVANATTGTVPGVFGETKSGNPAGIGVFGLSNSGRGVQGNSTNGSGVYGYSNSGTALYGLTDNGTGVIGSSTTGRGIYGVSATANSTIAGVWGENSAFAGTGVVGNASNTNGAGVAGTADPSGGTGVYGRGAANGISGNSTSGNGVYGGSSSGPGVFGQSTSNDGVYGTTNAQGSAGVYGQNFTAPSVGFGYGVTAVGPRGIHGITTGTSYAGYFDGFVEVTASLFVEGEKFFRIDHPLDPTNKYLLHASIESPEVKNLYDGTITTDSNGAATITLPSYFEALNRDFRYQLTVLGQFAQAIVASEIANNRFTIKTDKPGVRVSWQVTGIRQDAYMKAHPMVVEQDKPERERGTYQHPELFGQPEEKGLSWANDPALMKRLKEEREGRQREQINKDAAPAARPNHQ